MRSQKLQVYIESREGECPHTTPDPASGAGPYKDLKDDSQTQIRMKKELGMIDGVGIIVGIMIGSGIFISPTGVLRFSGSLGLSLIVWLLTGLFSMVGALCYVELGTMMPKAGGTYFYILEGLGELPAFLFLWNMVAVLGPTGTAIMALSSANYLLQPIFPNCDSPPDESVRLLAISIICFLTWLNCHDVKSSAKVTNLLTFIKISSLSTIIFTGVYYASVGSVQNFQKPFQNSQWSLSTLAVACYQGSFSYSGWGCLNFVSEELKDPNKNLPRAIGISVSLVTIIYFFTNAAYFVLLTPEEVLSSSAVAVTFGRKAFGELTWVMSVLVAILTFGSVNVSLLINSRIYLSAAREGQLPEFLSLINKHNLLPTPAVLFSGVTGCLVLFSSDVFILINYLTFVDTLFIFLSIVSLLWLRYKRPDMDRPTKIWLGYPIIYSAFCLLLIILPVIERPIELGIAIAILSAGVPIYYVCSKWSKSKSRCTNLMGIPKG